MSAKQAYAHAESLYRYVSAELRTEEGAQHHRRANPDPNGRIAAADKRIAHLRQAETLLRGAAELLKTIQ